MKSIEYSVEVLEAKAYDNLSEGKQAADMLLRKAKTLSRTSRIDLLRLRFKILARVHSMEEQLYEYSTTSADSKEQLKGKIMSASQSLSEILYKVEDFM